MALSADGLLTGIPTAAGLPSMNFTAATRRFAPVAASVGTVNISTPGVLPNAVAGAS